MVQFEEHLDGPGVVCNLAEVKKYDEHFSFLKVSFSRQPPAQSLLVLEGLRGPDNC